ncbi:hypothetical protein B0H34DRAFT_788449 [Crassisporium funariophilum]|nr:hypothetical protein B0H34DRAFT_788449 [Crassisporium funariophilum]
MKRDSSRKGVSKKKGGPSRQKTISSTRERAGKESLVDIAASTLEKIDQGHYAIDGMSYNLKAKVDLMNAKTAFHAADSKLSEWSSRAPELAEPMTQVQVTVSEISTLAGAQILGELLKSFPSEDISKKIGVLNFASAKNPGGGFMTGASAQEESIARSSTLFPSLMTNTAQKFYQSHRKDPKKGYYSHAMIYSPHVLLLRTDKGEWHEPLEVDIVTSPGVNAGVVRRYLRQERSEDESGIDAAMKEHGVRNIVLGSFGTGVFRNKVELVAGIWLELLTSENARFKHSFDHVIFAVLGNSTFRIFENSFAKNGIQPQDKS